MRRTTLLFMALAFFTILTAIPALAEWEPDGIRVAPSHLDQGVTRIVRADDGHVIIVWTDVTGYPNDNIYAQKYDLYGVAQWAPDGVPVCTEPSRQAYLEAVSDGSGGVIVTWADQRSGDYDIYAQRIDSNGMPLWTMDGVVVCSFYEDQLEPDIISDGTGGAVIVWNDNWTVVYWDIYAQRLDANGTVLWAAFGVPICEATETQAQADITADGTGGAIIAWKDERNALTDADMYAQRIMIDATGTIRWTTDGVAICTASGWQQSPDLVPDLEGGAIIVWEDNRGLSLSIYAQRIDSLGVVQWATDGIMVHQVEIDYHAQEDITPDGSGGVIVAWSDRRNGVGNNDIFAQRIDQDGNWQWVYSGVPVCTAAGDQGLTKIAPDDQGGYYIAWKDERYGAADIYAQRLRDDGVTLWPNDGVDVCAYDEEQLILGTEADGLGGAVVVWTDFRSGYYDQIYAQRIEPRYGHWGVPEPVIAFVTDITPDEGGSVALSWYGSQLDDFRYGEVTHYSIWRAMSAIPMFAASDEFPLLATPQDIGKDFDGSAIRIEQTASGDYFWEWIGNADALGLEGYSYTAPTRTDSTGIDPAIHYFQVVTHTQTPTTYWISAPDSGYSVDNLAPCPPATVMAEQIYTPEGLEITWEPNSEPDLSAYVIHRGTASDFAPDEGNLIYSECELIYFDGDWRWDSGYWYKVGAVDVHGNVSEYVLLGPEEVTGDEPIVPPAASYLLQNFPNPFNPVTRIRFGLMEPARVSLRIYDTSGRLVRTLVDGHRDMGHHAEEWDGRDAGGRAVASGVYFYKLEAGAFEETKKMILLR
jgi:predicted lipoprotein with Yx(FWY)xxD motif